MSVSAGEIASRLSLPAVELFDEVGSTLDVAHERAARGAPAGTLIVAEAQTAGRGRQGRQWRSERGAGLWLTLIERPAERASIDVLSLRVGLAIVTALEPVVAEPLGLKWPNDVYRGQRKLAGILVEARWRGNDPDWVAVGIGLNIRTPSEEPNAIGLEPADVSRLDALFAIVPLVRRAAAASGRLLADEIEAFAARDIARGQRITSPVPGIVHGIDETGALLVDTPTGRALAHAGSLVLERDQ